MDGRLLGISYKCTYDFTTECHVLSPHQIDPTRYVSILFPNVDTLDGILKQQVSWRVWQLVM